MVLNVDNQLFIFLPKLAAKPLGPIHGQFSFPTSGATAGLFFATAVQRLNFLISFQIFRGEVYNDERLTKGGRDVVETKASIIIEDFSALGQISLVAATTILQAMGITTALLPATVLSTQTEGFATPVALNTTNWQQATAQHWAQFQLPFQGALVGYLGSAQEVHTVRQIIHDLAPNQLVVDPVMADQGCLYPGLPATYPAALCDLCRDATVLTPNWTELCLLTGQSISEPNLKDCLHMAKLLHQAGITGQLVVTGIHQDGQIGSWLVHGDQLLFSGADYFLGHFYGTGDCFAALLYGYLTWGSGLHTAVDQATQALAVAVKETAAVPMGERLLGMQLKELVTYLTREK